MLHIINIIINLIAARMTEDIWMRNNHTIDFLIQEYEIPYLTEFLMKHDVKYKVLIEEVKESIDDAFIQKIPIRLNMTLPLIFNMGMVP